MVVLKATNVTKKYENDVIIEDISLEVKKGEIVSLLGVSGVGKTTLFHVLSGLLKPECGAVYLDNEEITGNPGRISYMLQKDLMLPHKKIIDNVALPLRIKGMSKKEARLKVNPMFEKFGIEGTQYKYPSQLSGGMRQRAALLRTYFSSNGVALLDEPFSALDTITKSAMHKWYLEVMKHIELATVVITHDIDEAIILSDRIYLMTGKPGKITEEIVIKEKKPRPPEFEYSTEFLEYKKSILVKLG